MSYAKLIIGALFLSNPYFGAIDYLPDFIGLLLISSAIKPLAEISPSAEASRSFINKAAAVSFFQITLLFPFLSIISSEPSFNLLYSFSFAVLRIIFLIPAIRELFNALRYFSSKALSSIKSIGFANVSTQAFLIFHCVMSVLPETVYLAVDEYGLYSDVIFPNAQYRTGIMFLCAAIVLVVGLIWFIEALVFLSHLKKNKPFNEAICESISEIVYSVKKAVLRVVSPATLCLTVACFTSVIYYVDGKPLLPPFVTCFFQLIALGYLRSVCKKRVTRAFSVIALIFGVLLQISCELFCAISHDRALFAFQEVSDQFMLPMICNIIYTLFNILSLISVGRAVCALIEEHTGLFWENAFITHNARVGKDKLHQLFMTRLLTVLLCISAVFGSISYALLYFIPQINLIYCAVCIVLGFVGFFNFGSVKSSVTEKYTTENRMN